MSDRFVVVTALFDMQREKFDGRTLTDYKKWISTTLKLKVPMVVYTEEKFKHFIMEERGDLPLIIVIQKLEEIPYYKYKEEMENVLNSEGYKRRIKHPTRIECRTPLYNIIQYSKFGWLRDAILHNDFDGDYYLWMDAGLSRFFGSYNLDKEWPSNMEYFKQNKFVIQCRPDVFTYPINDDFMWDSANLLIGGLFGASKELMIKVAQLVEEYFVDFLHRGMLNNEQLILSIIWKKVPQLFSLYPNYTNDTLPLFHFLGK